ncbi:MAG: glutaredoxin family protein [Actinobacteria bacterium]|uniref:Unannotated protein n=1 Tax=freshwater metagenome TaxID=449393 RepID=A0A6J6Q137_9ZZZZ|nr:glutaredoxin family protein [Actinomycetota bacterium]
MRVVSLYVGRDCHLCDIARSALGRLAEQERFVIDEIDITAVPALEAVYREWIPVVEVDRERISVYRVEEEPLLAHLRKAPLGDVTMSADPRSL